MINSNKLKIYLNSLFNKKSDKIILSISGGVDSVVLLHLLNQCFDQLNLHLVHIFYDKHPKAKDALSLIKKIANDCKIPLKIYSVKLSEKNFENNARLFRYDKLNKYREKINASYILTAHHLDDQIETLIMQDENKSDWISFLGIREINGFVVRPMLGTSKKEITEYAKSEKLIWIEDITNNDIRFRRNYIRNKILNDYYSKKYIKSLIYKHHYSINLMKAFRNLYTDNKDNCISYKFGGIYLKNMFTQYFKDIYFKILFKTIIKEYLNINFTINGKHWENLKKFIITSKQGSIFIISENLKILRDRDVCIIYVDNLINREESLKLKRRLHWHGTEFIISDNENGNIIDTLYCSQSIINKGIYVTYWNPGDFLIDEKTLIKQKISDIFINNKISRFKKINYPIVKNAKNDIIWIPNIKKNIKCNNECKKINWIINE